MIRIRLHTVDGVLTALESEGHAVRTGAGDSPACAVVSTLLQGLGQALVHRAGYTVDGSAPEPGRFSLSVSNVESAERGRLAGLTDLLVRQLKFVAREYPEDLQCTITEE